MADNLRDRIAALLYAMDCDDIQVDEKMNPAVLDAIQDGAERRADAVIAELGLQRHTGQGPYRNTYKYETGWYVDE